MPRIKKLNLAILQRHVFVSLVVLAPFSFIPSIATPLLNFSSFRVGGYQLLAGLFVLITALLYLKSKRVKYTANKRIPFSIGLFFVLSLVVGLIGAVDANRGLLMGVSVVFLMVMTLSVYSYVRGIKDGIEQIKPVILKATIFYGIVSVVQLLAALIWPDNALLCRGCGSDVFGFPRINGFAAEPLFWANALLPFLIVSFYSFYKNKDRLSLYALLASSLAIGLTFSRGAYVAVIAGLTCLAVVELRHRMFDARGYVKSLALSAAGLFAAFVLLIVSAVTVYSDAPYVLYNTARGMADQLSLGVVNLPEKLEDAEQAVVLDTVASLEANGVPEDEFVSEGLVEASTDDRTGSARLAMRAWNNPSNYIFGVGIGNLGPYVVANVDPSAPSNLTVYIFYVLVLAELGIAGLVSLLALYGLALKKLWDKRSVEAVVCAAVIVSFLVQYIFFGSYINVVYVWLWLGVGLGLGLGRRVERGLQGGN